MKIKPIHLIVGGAILVAAIYFFAKTTAPVKTDFVAGGHPMPESKPTMALDLSNIITQAKINLQPSQSKNIDSLSQQLSTANSAQKIILLKKLIAVWQQNGSKIISAEYTKQLAEATSQPSDFANAGAMLTDAFENAADSNMRKSLCDEAFSTLQRAIELDTNNIDNKVNMAALLMEGRGQVMDGVPILLGIVKKSPNNLKANFVLAKFAVVSGQFDKAIIRLKKIISLNPTYTDAYLTLANAYAQKGEMANAKATLQQCEQHLQDEKAKAEVKKLIEKFN